jgi:predicted nucleic acid-binding protein
MNGIKPRIVFDSCIMIRRLKEKRALSELRGLFVEHDRFISVITRIELLSYHGITAAEETEIRAFLEDVTAVPLFEEIEQTVIAFRRAQQRKTPDSIIAATALALDATLITIDPHLLNASWPGLHTADLN